MVARLMVAVNMVGKTINELALNPAIHELFHKSSTIIKPTGRATLAQVGNDFEGFEAAAWSLLGVLVHPLYTLDSA